MKKSVLIITTGYIPGQNYGGPVTSILNLVNKLANNYEFYIITSDHDLGVNKRFEGIKDGWNRVGHANVLYLSDKDIKFSKIKSEINKINPTKVYVNSLFAYKFLMLGIAISNKNNIPLIIAPRGELCINALKIKKCKKYLYINLLKHFKILNNAIWHSTSEEESESIIEVMGITKSKVVEIPNLIKEYKVNRNFISKKIGYLNIVFISRITKKKNLKYAIELVNELDGVINFDIYGPKEDEKYYQESIASFELNPNKTINYKGILDKGNIIPTLMNYDLFLFPTLSENFGHVIAEAVQANCPIIISNNTPWNDINESGGGYAIDLKDKSKFIDILQMFVEMDEFKYREILIKLNNYKRSKVNNEIHSIEYNKLFNGNEANK